MDYNIIDFLPAIFEEYTYDSSTGTHTFANLNGSRPPSFAIRYKKLNRIVGGPNDETTELRGCVASALSIKQTSSSATLDVTLRFTYNTQVSVYSDLSETDFDDYYETTDPLPVEWTCLYVGDESVAGTESSGFDVSNNLGTVAGCGTRFDSNYYVGKVDVSISTSVYSTDPKRYLTLMYSGGYDDTLTSPQDKALRPIPEVSLRSSETVDSDTYSCIATFEDVYVGAGGATSFTDSKVVDSPTLKAKSVTLAFRNTRGRITAWD